MFFQSGLVACLLGGEHAWDLSKLDRRHGVLSCHCADRHLAELVSQRLFALHRCLVDYRLKALTSLHVLSGL